MLQACLTTSSSLPACEVFQLWALVSGPNMDLCVACHEAGALRLPAEPRTLILFGWYMNHARHRVGETHALPTQRMLSQHVARCVQYTKLLVLPNLFQTSCQRPDIVSVMQGLSSKGAPIVSETFHMTVKAVGAGFSCAPAHLLTKTALSVGESSDTKT